MNTISSSTPMTGTPNFNGWRTTRYYINKFQIMDRIINPKQLHKSARRSEYSRGYLFGQENKNKPIDSFINDIKDELIEGNFDAFKGICKALGKDVSKKIYSLV